MGPKPRFLIYLDGFSAFVILAAVYLVLFYAPVEVVMGQVQKVFYFHVATAWVGMLGFIAAAGAGILYLIKDDLRWDKVGVSAVEISLVFFFTAIVTGSIWARPTWNTWWTWDPRLTTAAVVELIYLAYFLLRRGVDDHRRRARFSAVYAIFGAFSVPLTFISIRLLRTIHPVVVGNGAGSGSGGFNMIPSMQITFFVSLFAFTVFFADLLWHRIRLEEVKREIQALRSERWDQIEGEL